MFYKITEKGIEKAPKFLLINGKQVFTNSEKLHNEYGYYKLKELPYPIGDGNYQSIYELQDKIIVKNWEKIEEDLLSYEDRVVNRIRERYNINQELAILRQRDVKFDEWMEYNNYVEQIKAEEKAREEVINNG